MKPGRRLDEVATIVMGQAPPGEAYNSEGKGWPLIAGASDFDGMKPSIKKYTSEASKISEPGDIIIGIRATIGKRVVSDGNYCLGRGVAAIRARDVLDVRYLWYWLGYIAPELAAKGKGATFKQVTREDIGEILIELPTLAGQQRVASILERAEELRVKRRVAMRTVDSLAQSIFFEMFGDPRYNSMSWEVATFGSVVDEFRYGTSNKSSNSGFPALRIPNVIGGSLDLAELKSVPISTSEEARLRLLDDDLLFVRTNGNADYVGRCALFSKQAVESTGYAPDRFIYASYLIRARLLADRVAPIYVREFMLGAAGRDRLRERCRTSAGQFNINIDGLKGVPIPLPPIERQREFTRRVIALEPMKAAYQAHLTGLDTIFASLQHRAFRGEL